MDYRSYYSEEFLDSSAYNRDLGHIYIIPLATEHVTVTDTNWADTSYRACYF